MSTQESDTEERPLHNATRPRGLLFGLWQKRSTKVEPHPMTGSLPNVGKSTTDISFAKCSPLKRAKRQYNNSSSHACSDTNRPCSIKSHNSSNNNRFSHQFSLCCSVEHRPQTPPVSVKYNSLPDSVNIREKLRINLNDCPAPLAEIESNSAPETPMNGKGSFNSNSSPSSNSVQSTQSDGQPKSIAITACRSRLRLKLLPPGKSIIGLDDGAGGDTAREIQHLSSPNISSQQILLPPPENVRSISHEGIQSIHRSTQEAGTDSLAKQALVAAQVLSLIPTEKARQRNYMAGRLAVNSLLGASELTRVLPNKQITIFVGTWNMNGQCPPKQMNDFVLPTGVEHVPDLVAIGTQESCSERFEWEVTLQETLGPTHILFHSTYLGTLHLAVFLRRDLVWFCSMPEDGSMSVRPGTAFRTKGAVAISFCIFGTTLLFVTSHLTAHQQKVKERVQDVKRITHALDLPKNLHLRHKNKDVTQNFDCVFWCGDLNFRLGEPREKILEWIENTNFPLPSHLPHGVMHTDQLSSVLSDGAAFKGFREANITFPPTYKYDPGTQQFDTSSKQRAPAYTDRILFKYRSPSLTLRRASAIGPFLNTQQTPPMECLAYDSVPTITSSDHKPVWALFCVNIRPGIDTIPLAAGLFNREVYLEGMRRRLNNSFSGSSAVCSVQ